MATSDGGALRAAVVELSSDSDSDNSYLDSAGDEVDDGDNDISRPGPYTFRICQWRTPEFHDRECSRYFDCPTHVIERVLSDHEQAAEGDTDAEGDIHTEAYNDTEEEADHEDMQRGGSEESGVSESRGFPGNGHEEAAAEAHDHPASAIYIEDDEARPRGTTTTSTPQSTMPNTAAPEPSTDSREVSRGGVAEHASRASIQHDNGAVGTATNPIILVDSSPELPRSELAPADNAGQSVAVTTSTTPQSVPSIARTNDPVSPVPPWRRQSAPSTGTELLRPSLPPPAPPPTLPTPSVPRPAERRGPPEIVLPRWQPDAEVTYCPICHTQFSIFVRKHHCRKCGRVVCNACSPHRITIPYQYIVQPPGAPRTPQRHSTLFFGDVDFGSIGGGERVRLCNPCVPDPNTTPHQAQAQTRGLAPGQAQGNSGHARSQSSLSTPYPDPNNHSPTSSRWVSYFSAAPANDAYARSRSVTMQSGPPSSSGPQVTSHHHHHHQHQHPYPHSTQSRILAGTPPAYYPSASSSSSQRHHPYPGIASRYRSMVDVGHRPPRTVPGGSSSSSAVAAGGSASSSAVAAGPSAYLSPSVPGPSSSSAHRRMQPPSRPQQHQIAEEDECPVCHRELPPRTLPNFEALREAHISICITSHSTYSASPATAANTSGAGDAPGNPPLPPIPPRRTGMFPYVATEKDCVDSAECTICLEEFEVGVPMARLECLCRFHRACISAWWERHPGRCPMHQHDSYGY
ncbi:FYVE zinc finger-domain-containing protein [Diplogelasinospora grovesii]|uniref:FYVE zinc finger-domain-containing protein n=1 Tax=Diplogelasinospora grovesii TaxID=303347 RepID=A0AAN6N6D7_9PEZI|nr:FYVE zinc finger-domain-containing protein [Diplogelasinospora grovesii]